MINSESNLKFMDANIDSYGKGIVLLKNGNVYDYNQDEDRNYYVDDLIKQRPLSKNIKLIARHNNDIYLNYDNNVINSKGEILFNVKYDVKSIDYIDGNKYYLLDSNNTLHIIVKHKNIVNEFETISNIKHFEMVDINQTIQSKYRYFIFMTFIGRNHVVVQSDTADIVYVNNIDKPIVLSDHYIFILNKETNSIIRISLLNETEKTITISREIDLNNIVVFRVNKHIDFILKYNDGNMVECFYDNDLNELLLEKELDSSIDFDKIVSMDGFYIVSYNSVLSL